LPSVASITTPKAPTTPDSPPTEPKRLSWPPTRSGRPRRPSASGLRLQPAEVESPERELPLAVSG
jgi:hypothetical protein